MATRLLPNANPVAYNELVNASINSEGLVNGIWVSCVPFLNFSSHLTLFAIPRILNFHFPTNAIAWSISPEVRTPPGGRLDLFITRNTYNPFRAHPTVIFEGKSANGDFWDQIRTQLRQYAITYATANGQFIYMIGAKGRGCRFFRYKRGDAIDTTYMAYNPNTRRVSYQDSGLATTSDISTDQPAILAFIQEILRNPTPLSHIAVEYDTEPDSQTDV